MGKNTESNKKCTWTVLAAIAPFPLLLKENPPSFLCPKILGPLAAVPHSVPSMASVLLF